MLKADLDDACFAPMNDPEVARAAHGAGVGSRIEKCGGEGRRILSTASL